MTVVSDEACANTEFHDADDPFLTYEWISVLYAAGGRFRSGKSYRPDPSGARWAVKAGDYALGSQFLSTDYSIENLSEFFELLKDLAEDPHAFIVRGVRSDWSGHPQGQHRLTKQIGYKVYRRSVKVHGSEGYFSEWPFRHLQMLDLDGISLAQEMSVVAEPETCVKWAVEHLLPPEFADTSFVYQLSSSAGLTKRDDELNVHLWFYTKQTPSNEKLRSWARWWNAQQQQKIIDPAVFTEVQPHYTNNPELLDGLIDPLAGRRLGHIRRRRQTVVLYLPTDAEIAQELGERKQRALRQHKRSIQAPQSNSSLSADDSGTGHESGDVLEIGGNELLGGPYFDAINLSRGWRGYLMGIGFEGHIRMQLRAAIASYFHERGSHADRVLLKTEIEKAVADSPFLDCGEPWSRPRQDALHYLTSRAGSDSNVDDMISYIAARQVEKERVAYEVCQPSWSLPALTAAEAYTQIEAAIKQVIGDASERKRRLQHLLEPWLLFENPKRAAINCSTGTGKTQAMIAGVIELLRSDQTARASIAVPTHALGEGLASRINDAYGSEVAAEWYGIDHADPLASGKSMCRLSDAARELIALGGKLQQLCSRRNNTVHYCAHHPSIAGSDGCGYQRQQTPAVTQQTRVWIVPATMLSLAPPPALGGDFDLLVIDEAPWFNLLQKEPIKIPLEWLSPDWPEAHQARATQAQRNSAAETLTKIFLALSALGLGEVPQDLLVNQGIRESDLSWTRRTVWRYKVDLRKYVRPGWKLSKLKRELAGVEPHNRRVVGVAQALEIFGHQVGGRLAPSGVLITEKNNKKYLGLRWRRDIDSAWLKPPTLYLDAVDIGTYEIAKAWLPDLTLELEARAKAPHMQITQLVDSSMAYRKFSALAKRGRGNGPQ